MKNLFVPIISCLALLSCTSGHQDNTPTDSVEKTTVVANTKPIDLAELTLNEKDAPGMLAAQNVKPEPAADNEQTLFGYEVFKSSSPKVLQYGGEDLSGANGAKKNHALFHYNQKTKALAFFEVKLYTQAQADALLKQLQKISKPQFEKVGVEKGAIELDLNGNEVQKGKEQKQTYRVWENKNNNLSYFYSELGSGKDFEATLTVLNRSAGYAKEWISFSSLDWYKTK